MRIRAPAEDDERCHFVSRDVLRLRELRERDDDTSDDAAVPPRRNRMSAERQR